MQHAQPVRLVKYFAAGVALIASAVGCTAMREPPALEQARVAYQRAQQNRNMSARAPLVLREAEQTLQRAERAWVRDKDQEEVQHLVYPVERKVEIARANAEQKMAEADMQWLLEELERVLLESRGRHLRRAGQEAEQARQEAQQAATRGTALPQELAELRAKESERGFVFTLGDVLFESNRADLRPGAMRNLDPLVTFLKNHPERQVLIEGYTDSIGSEQYNLELSQRRADAVRDYIVSHGISPKRIASRGYGKAHPVASNNTEGGRQENRRVEFTIVR